MARSQAERLWLIGGGVTAFLMLLLGYFLFIGPQQDETSDVDSDVASVQAANETLQAQLTRLAAQSKDLARYEAEARQSRLALPDKADLQNFLRTLQSIGSSTRTNVSLLAAGIPVDVSTVANGAPVVSTQPSTQQQTLNQVAPPRPNAAAGNATGKAKPNAVYALPITATVTGSVSSLNQFLTQLQSVQPRGVLVSQLTEAVAERDGAPTSQITMTMYAFVAPATTSDLEQLQTAAAAK